MIIDLLLSALADASSFAYLLLAVGLFLLTFERLKRLDRSALLSVRLAYWVLGVTAVLSVASVIAWGHDPDWIECGLLAAFTLLQCATRRAWRDTYPAHYASAPGELDDQAHHYPTTTPQGR